MIFYCVHCTDANELTESCYGSIEDVFGHWLSGHTDLKDTKPFWFYVTQPIACYHCVDYCGSYHDMIKHFAAKHADNGYAIVRKCNRNECALCMYTGTDLLEHFAEHDGLLVQDSNIFNPARLPESLIGDLFAIDIHKKRQCGCCDGIFETQHEIEAHLKSAHPDQVAAANEYFDSKSA